MNKFLLGLICLLITNSAFSEMLLNSQIGNDPEKERVCEMRAKGKKVPFEIDSNYVASARSMYPDATFIALDEGSPHLIQCNRSEATGKFQPFSWSPEQKFWSLIRPKGFEPGLNTNAGHDKVRKACKEVFLEKINRPNLERAIVDRFAKEIDKSKTIYWEKRKRNQIGGKQLERYDVFIDGTAYYQTGKIDLDAIPFACLFSPMLELKSFQLKAH